MVGHIGICHGRIRGLFWALCLHVIQRIHIIGAREDDLVIIQGLPLGVVGRVL